MLAAGKDMADKAFRNENLEVLVEAELVSLRVTIMPLWDDPKVARARTRLLGLHHINHERELKCPLRQAVESAPHVNENRRETRGGVLS